MRIPPPARTGPRSRRRDAGSASVEMVLITPLIVLLLLLAVAMSRMVAARIDTDASAQQAARAASLARDPGAADRAARQAAESTLAGEGRTCGSIQVSTDAAAFRAGGIARVTVTCTTTLSDLGLPLPGHHDSTSRAAAPVDTFTYREATP